MGDEKERVLCITDRQLREAVRETVHETLTAFGVDVRAPLEMQRDLQHLRDLRVATTIVKKRALHVLVGVVVAGVIAAFWVGFKDFIHS